MSWNWAEYFSFLVYFLGMFGYFSFTVFASLKRGTQNCKNTKLGGGNKIVCRPGLANFEIRQFNARVDLLALCGVDLKKVAQSEGGEWAGPCPVCGGRDRFHVQPAHRPEARWLCRKCTEGKWRSAYDLARAVGRERVGRFEGSQIRTEALVTNGTLEPETFKPETGGPANMQTAFMEAVECGVRGLWNSAGGVEAVKWLEGRGLEEATLRYFLVGWSRGMRVRDVYIPAGVMLPCWVDEQVWYIKIALAPGQMVRCEGCQGTTAARQACPNCGRVNKYRGVKGNRSGAIFNADDLAVEGDGRRPALFVEGEFDCMVAWQAVRRWMAVVTLGSASGRIEMTYWGVKLLQASRIYTLYDNDEAGERGREVVRELCAGGSRDLHLPMGFKDVNEFVLAGGELGTVVSEGLGDS